MGDARRAQAWRDKPGRADRGGPCSLYSMAFSNGLAKAGHHPERLNTTAEVEFVPGTGITTITLTVRGHIHGIEAGEFQKLAQEAKDGCPVSQALKGNVKINLKAELDHTH